jgi:hypothetical protein
MARRNEVRVRSRVPCPGTTGSSAPLPRRLSAPGTRGGDENLWRLGPAPEGGPTEVVLRVGSLRRPPAGSRCGPAAPPIRRARTRVAGRGEPNSCSRSRPGASIVSRPGHAATPGALPGYVLRGDSDGRAWHGSASVALRRPGLHRGLVGATVCGYGDTAPSAPQRELFLMRRWTRPAALALAVLAGAGSSASRRRSAGCSRLRRSSQPACPGCCRRRRLHGPQGTPRQLESGQFPGRRCTAR